MFESKLDILKVGHAHRYGFMHNAMRLRYADVIRLWQHSEPFRAFFIHLLAAVPFPAYRWETPPVTLDTVDRPFECVVLNSPGLARMPDPHPFARYFTTTDVKGGIVVFENLGKDATLVVPSPEGPDAAYGHLAAFTRQAPSFQHHALWTTVGEAMQQRLADRPVWLSTAGGGVSWLHVRLDDRPKYYGFRPYRES